jgi:hypothetical protein
MSAEGAGNCHMRMGSDTGRMYSPCLGTTPTWKLQDVHEIARVNDARTAEDQVWLSALTQLQLSQPHLQWPMLDTHQCNADLNGGLGW